MSEWRRSGSIHRFRIEKTIRSKRLTPGSAPSSPCVSLDAKEPEELLPLTSGGRHLNENCVASNSSLSPLACERCRRLKRKCDRVLPECIVCSKAGVFCQFPETLDSTLKHRIEWLSAFVDTLLPTNISVESLRTGASLQTIVHPSSPSSLLEMRYDSSLSGTSLPSSPIGLSVPPVDIASLDIGSTSEILRAYAQRPVSKSQLHPVRNLPPGITFMDLVKAYFLHKHRGYPFLDQNKIFAEAESMEDVFKQESIEINVVSLRLFLVTALGCEFLCRTRQVDSEHYYGFKVPYHEVAQMCIGNASTESVQILLLLALHSNSDPQGWPPWIVTSLLVRQAVLTGLNLKLRSESNFSHQEMESRNRLFWCIFSFDRLVSTSFGLDFAINKNDIDVPLPGVTTDEFVAVQQADYFTTLQVARQAIALHELDGQIFFRVHLESYRGMSPPLERRDRRRLIDQYRAQADNWYTQGCFLARLDIPNVPVHNTIPWLNASFHWTLVLLYSPSHFNPQATSSELLELQKVIHKYIRSIHVLFNDRHLAWNHNNASRLVIVGRMLLHCLSHIHTSDYYAQEEYVLKCIDILKSYPSAWKFAQPSLRAYEKFLNFVRGTYMRRSEKNGVRGSDMLSEPVNGITPVIDEFESLIRQGLGDASVYNFLSESRKLEKL